MHRQPTTILLMSTPHPHWSDLQVMLRKQRHIQVIGEAQEGAQAVRAVAADQPDLVIADSDVPDLPLVLLVRAMRAASPVSQIVVVGRLRTRAEHITLTELGVRGFVLWADVDAESVGAILTLARRGLRMASEAVIVRRDTPEPAQERRPRPGAGALVLTDEERFALEGKATGLGEREIAAELHMSVPTVERVLKRLRDKLGVATTCALCAKAVYLGLITLDTER